MTGGDGGVDATGRETPSELVFMVVKDEIHDLPQKVVNWES